ncbi:hypothetical protein ABIE88_001805 [Bradyrhizobium diazoefficiens]
MQETPAADKTLARVFAIDEVVDRGEIALAVALASFRSDVLPRDGLRVLHTLRGCRMRRGEVLRARIQRGLAGLELGIALHRGKEARGTIRVEMCLGGDADADAVRLELLVARKARHGELGLGQRERGEIGIVAHVGDNTGDDRGLARLVLAHRGVLGQHMRHLVAEHGGQLRRIARERKKTARDIELAVRQREGVDRAGIQNGDPVALVGAVGGGDEPVDGLGDQRFEPRVVIGAAIARQDALVLLFGGGGLRDGRLRLGHRDRRRGRRGLEPVHVAATGERRAQQKA